MHVIDKDSVEFINMSGSCITLSRERLAKALEAMDKYKSPPETGDYVKVQDTSVREALKGKYGKVIAVENEAGRRRVCVEFAEMHNDDCKMPANSPDTKQGHAHWFYDSGRQLEVTD